MNDCCDLDFFTKRLFIGTPEQEDLITIIKHSNHGSVKEPMTQKRVKNNILQFENATGITFFACTDDKRGETIRWLG